MRCTRQVNRWGMLFLLSLTPYLSLASQFEAVVSGVQLKWRSLEKVTNGQAPAYWEIPLGLPAGQYVIPGGVSNVGEQQIRVSSGSKHVSLPITVKGMIYRLSSNEGSTPEPGGGAITSTAGSDILVAGRGAGSLLFELKGLESPITHYRPYISTINETQWLNAFKSVGLPKGVYKGSLPITALYDYVRDGVRVRYMLDFSLSVVVDYAPQFLHSVTASDGDVMTVKYHYPLQVSGETQYTITATGYFTNGIWIGLVPPVGADYFSLKNSTGEKEIKYNVTCVSGCVGDNRLIINGVPNINTTKRAVIGAVDAERAAATLKVDFDPVSEPEFKGETYTGTFTLMFEARI